MANNKKHTTLDDSEENKERHWYAVHTYSGYEDAVARYLSQRVDSLAMNDRIFNVIVPKEMKIKIRGGKRHVMEEKIFHGYVLVDMILDQDSWYVVRNTPRVAGFVGPDPANPSPLSKEEVDSITQRMAEKEPVHKVDFKKNESVKIIDGPFKDRDGKVVKIDEARGRVKVVVPMFGRDTTVELDTLQVEKI